MTTFFVPAPYTSEEFGDEAAYAELAKYAEAEPSPGGKRIESITWMSNTARWTATVGQQLFGARTRMRQRHGRQVQVTDRLFDSAKVLAIFDRVDCYLIVTDAQPLGPKVSQWVNPINAGQPVRVGLFD